MSGHKARLYDPGRAHQEPLRAGSALGGPVARANVAAAEAGRSRNVVTSWPGLAPDQLHQRRDLLHTTDFRDVRAELVRVHLGNPNLEKVLPAHEFKPVGLVEPV